MKTRFVILALAALAVASASASVAAAAPDGAPNAPVHLQILAVSDWHGQLDPLAIQGVGDVGGAGTISTYWQKDRIGKPNTLTLTAGDGFGATPPLASFFDEEPAVKAMNLMGFTADTFGNHNFDKGVVHLQRMIDLADFDYIAANLRNIESNLSGVDPWKLYHVGGIKVAVIGLVNPEAPTLVFPGSFGSIELLDAATVANKRAQIARKAGASVVIVLIHAGMTGREASGVATGPLRDFAEQVENVDLIMGDHTDFEFQGQIGDAYVIENKSKGATYSKTQLVVDGAANKVTSIDNQIVVPFAGAANPPDPAIQSMLAPYRADLSSKLDGKIGEATALFPRAGNNERLGEAAIGNIATDAMRISNGTQISITNGGGIRKPLPSDYLPADHTLRRTTAGYAAGPPYDLVLGDGYAIFPFGNAVLTRMISGTQLLAALERGVSAIPASQGFFLQVSGFKFVFDSSKPVGSRVVSATLDGGAAILPGGVFTVAMPDFMNAGGDGYTMFVDGQTYATRNLLADAFNEYVAANTPVTPVLEGRITNIAP